jgi:formate dehydrogenase subunit gamma
MKAQPVMSRDKGGTAQAPVDQVTGEIGGGVSAETTSEITAGILARRAHQLGALLPILHELQDRLGWVPKQTVPQIAEALNLSRAEVHGVVTYYHHFRSSAPGRHVVQVCRAEACQARGADDLLAQAESLLGCKSHHTRADGAVTLNPVYCLGLCALSPAVMVDERVYGRVTPQRLQEIAAALELAA